MQTQTHTWTNKLMRPYQPTPTSSFLVQSFGSDESLVEHESTRWAPQSTTTASVWICVRDLLKVQSKEISKHHNNGAAFELLISTDVKFVNIFQNKIEHARFWSAIHNVSCHRNLAKYLQLIKSFICSSRLTRFLRIWIASFVCLSQHVKGKGKVIPLQTRCGPEGG